MQSIAQCRICHGQHLESFDPFSLYFCNNFPFDRPFGAPFMMPPTPPMPPMPRMEPCMRSEIEYKETTEAHLFTAKLPGMTREDVKIHVDDSKVLHISAQKKYGQEERRENYHHVERGFGEFVSRFKLPSNSRPELVRTCVENGLLTVTVPKETVDIRIENHHQQRDQYY